MTKPAFQPAPRPRPRTSPEEALLLAQQTEHLGFTRASNAPETAVTASTNEVQKTKGELAQTERVFLKLAVPSPLARELRQTALDRGVTVQFLMLEALAKTGYAIDLETVPEDGRRVR